MKKKSFGLSKFALICSLISFSIFAFIYFVIKPVDSLYFLSFCFFAMGIIFAILALVSWVNNLLSSNK
jgi:succinate-acetate transporter protein